MDLKTTVICSSDALTTSNNLEAVKDGVDLSQWGSTSIKTPQKLIFYTSITSQLSYSLVQ